MSVHALPRPDLPSGRPELRIRLMDISEPQSPQDFAAIFSAIDSLMLVSALSAMRVRMGARDQQSHMDIARGAIFGVQVVRISYASPLEVLLGASAGLGVGIALFERAVDAFDKFQDSRAKKAATDASVAGSKLEELQYELAFNALNEQLAPGSQAPAHPDLQKAATLLTTVETLETTDESA